MNVRRALLFAPMLQNKGRLALSVFAVALGIALGYAVRLVNEAAINEFALAVQSLSGEADLEVRAGAKTGFDESWYPRLARLSQVSAASPMLEMEAKLPGRREPLTFIGLDIFRAMQVQPALAGGDIGDRLDFLRPDRVMLSRAAAQWLGLDTSGKLAVQIGLKEARFKIAGIVGHDLRRRFVIMDIAAAQAAFGREGQLNLIDLRLRAGADVDRFAETLRAMLPPGVVIERPEANIERGRNASRAYRVNLNVLALVALFTGGLLVFSTQALAVVRRRAQFALLRVIGLTRRELLAMLLAEAAVIGAAGAALGIALGHATAELILRRFGAELGAGYFRGLYPVLPLDAVSVAIYFALGVATALTASLAPALEATRASIAAALKAGDEQRAFERLRPVWPGVAMLLTGAMLTLAGPMDGLPIPGYTAIAFLLVGVLMLMPRLAMLAFRIVPLPVLAPGRIAISQLRGAPGQAGVSLAAIVASVSLMVSMAIMVASFRMSFDEWLDRVLPADLYVRTGVGSETAFLSIEDQQMIATLPGVRRVEFMRVQRLIVDPGKPLLILLARPVGERPPPLVESLSERVADMPFAWVSEIASDVHGWRTGDVIGLPLAGEIARFTVVGIWRDYVRQQGAVLVERDDYIRFTGDRNANDAAIWLASGASATDVRLAMEARVAGSANLDIASPGEIRDDSLRIFDRTFAVTYALEAVAVLIGLFGLSASFGALVLARRREFGVLRHIGMTRGQIGTMLATEGALVSALGLAVGLVLGWLISLVLIHVVNRQSFHWSMELHVPWGMLAQFALTMLVLATLTALASGRRAMGGDPVRAVREDW